MKVLISNETHEDIDSIFEYISFDSLKYANKTSEKIYSYIGMLESYPYLGRNVLEFPNKQ